MPELATLTEGPVRRPTTEPLLPVLEEVHQPPARVQPLPPHQELPGSTLRAHKWL
jgi:hypothetical protein